MTTVTVRLGKLDGPALGAFAHPTMYDGETVRLGEQTYDVVASAKTPMRQTLAVVEKE